jgi:2-methylfumaryl-CoA isomerase
VLGIEAEISEIEAQRGISFAKDEGLRFTHRDALFPLFEQQVAKWTWTDLDQAFGAAGCCYGPYQTMLDAAHDPVLVTKNPMFNTTDNPSGEIYPASGAFATLPQMERQPAQSAPTLGADTDTILARLLGLDQEHLDELKSQGLVATS